MQLPVVTPDADSAEPWYAEGLSFTCTQCGNCCTGGPGFVWISQEEIVRLADHLGISPADVVDRYCRKVAGRFTLVERRTPGGLYDCVFLTESPLAEGDEATKGDGVVRHRKRGCSIYPVRPLQCRTWPFWPENLGDPDAWGHAAVKCHGMNRPGRVFTKEAIETLRDCEDWPERPPTSGPEAAEEARPAGATAATGVSMTNPAAPEP